MSSQTSAGCEDLASHGARFWIWSTALAATLVTVGKWPWWEMFGAIGHYRSQMPEVKSFESA